MALATYADLQAAVIRWPDLTGEDDITNNIEDIILLGEKRIARTVRLQGMLTQLVEGASPPYTVFPFPADCLEIDKVLDNQGNSLEFRQRDELFREGYRNLIQPTYYTINGRQLYFVPTVQEFVLEYYQEQEALVTADTNYLYAKAPGLYLYACLVEASVFSKEAQQEMDRYLAQYNAIVAELMAEDDAVKRPRSQPRRASVGRPGRVFRS